MSTSWLSSASMAARTSRMDWQASGGSVVSLVNEDMAQALASTPAAVEGAACLTFGRCTLNARLHLDLARHSGWVRPFGPALR
ncbi:hypothetical protein NOVOSPHI9U_40624 [Novosphingobium sp. 9U]|nr:hypothetical protein NOVOSPHI9U_40624 [Novosphingobium sp. 9U]